MLMVSKKETNNEKENILGKLSRVCVLTIKTLDIYFVVVL